MDRAVELYRLFLRLYGQLHKTQLSLKESQALPLTTGEDHYLGIIYDLGKPTFSEFAKAAGISKPAATKIIRNFIEKKYLTKVQSEVDRRRYYLILEKEVIAYFKTTDDAFIEVLHKRLEDVPNDEIESFKLVLLKMLEEKPSDKNS